MLDRKSLLRSTTYCAFSEETIYHTLKLRYAQLDCFYLDKTM